MKLALTRILLLSTALSLSAATAALAVGGGGGEADVPSISTPQYDPAEEFQKGVAAMQISDFKKAERAFDRVTQAAPESGEGWRMLGTARLSQKNAKGAAKAYQKAVKLNPQDVDAHQGLGVSLAQTKDAAKAKAELEWLNARLQACGSCAQADSLKKAAGAVEAAMSGAPTAALPSPLIFASAKTGDRAYLAAVELINEHRYQDALTALDQARQAFGPHPDVITYQGYAWRKLGEFDRAETYYREALNVAPEHKGATEYYGELKVERGDMAGAKAMLARLDSLCDFGCAEAETLRRWVVAGHEPTS